VSHLRLIFRTRFRSWRPAGTIVASRPVERRPRSHSRVRDCSAFRVPTRVVRS
jgi:hypothetical protein